MKPRYKPGKPATGGRTAREAVTKAKPLSENQMEHIRKEKIGGGLAPKAGKKGARAHWDIDYAEGVEFDSLPMPHREPESQTIDGVRRWPKRGK